MKTHNVIIPLDKKICNSIFEGANDLVFFKTLPHFSKYKKIYLYEKGGSKHIVGECVAKEVIQVKRKDGTFPMFGCYPFLEHYLEGLGKNDFAKEVRELKSEFEFFPNYKYGFIAQYLLSPYEIESFRTNKASLSILARIGLPNLSQALDDNNKSRMLLQDCDNYLQERGFYNEGDCSTYLFGVVVDKVKRYKTPYVLSQFQTPFDNPISKITHWTYAKKIENV